MLPLNEIQDISTYVAPIQIPTFDALTIPAAPSVPTIPAAFVYRAYGTVVQDLIDGRITDFSTYFTPIMVIQDELAYIRFNILQKYHRERKKFLNGEGAKNGLTPSGRLQRLLHDLTLAEKQEISEETGKIIAARLGESVESLANAIQSGLASHASRFDEHHRLQSASLAVAKAATDAAIKEALLKVDQYNAWIDTIKAQYKAYRVQMQAYTQQMESSLFDLKAQIVVAGRQAIAADLGRLAAELSALQAQYDSLQFELLVLQAERERQAALKVVSDAELALAYIREITASAEMSKAGARQANVAVTYERFATALRREQAEGTKTDTRLAANLKELDVKAANHQLDELRDRLERLRIETRTVIAGIETAAHKADAQSVMDAAEQEVSAEQAAQSLVLSGAAQVETMLQLQGQALEQQRTQLSLDKLNALDRIEQAGEHKVNAIQRATDAAVDSELHSELHYRRG